MHERLPENVRWKKSSRSQGGGECVEVAITDDALGVRDSKAPTAGQLVVPLSAWTALARSLKG